jgi:inosine-uridine nucleoside N-ribohydrolase
MKGHALSETTRRSFILDTDIGTDVDDIFALVILARAPEIDLIGVTTVYGDTVLRARICRYVVDTLNRPEIDVLVGESQTLSHRPVWWSGHEGRGIPSLDDIEIDSSESAVDYLIRQSLERSGELEIAAIGPLTNVAMAISRDPGFGGRIRHLYIMGGVFSETGPEHNIKCDPEAADIVFSSEIPMTVVGLDVTKRLLWGQEAMDRIGASNGELGPVLAEQLKIWWDFTGKSENHPHDPIAVMTAIRPDLFTFSQGSVHSGTEAGNLAQTTFTPNPAGSARVALDLDVNQVSKALLQGIGA